MRTEAPKSRDSTDGRSITMCQPLKCIDNEAVGGITQDVYVYSVGVAIKEVLVHRNVV